MPTRAFHRTDQWLVVDRSLWRSSSRRKGFSTGQTIPYLSNYSEVGEESKVKNIIGQLESSHLPDFQA